MHLEPFAIPTFTFNGDAKHSGIYQSKQYALQFLSLMFCKKEAVRAKKEEKVQSQFSCFFFFPSIYAKWERKWQKALQLGPFSRGGKKGQPGQHTYISTRFNNYLLHSARYTASVDKQMCEHSTSIIVLPHLFSPLP